MTQLVCQKSGSDCFLACIAMALGKTWDETWSEADLNQVIADKGVGDADPWFLKAGLMRAEYRTIYTYGRKDEDLARLLWGRRAILSVKSLNIPGGNHAVYWDGDQLYDPNPEWSAEGVRKERFKYIESLNIQQVYVLR